MESTFIFFCYTILNIMFKTNSFEWSHSCSTLSDPGGGRVCHTTPLADLLKTYIFWLNKAIRRLTYFLCMSIMVIVLKGRRFYVPRSSFGGHSEYFGCRFPFIDFGFRQVGGRTLNDHQIQRFEARDLFFNIVTA